ncbi:MAG: hypothetical protein U0Q22_06595 [Acidimicrobiales bacterium]
MTALGELLAAYLLGAVVAAGLWRGSRGVFAVDVFARTNYRSHPLATAVGLLLAVVPAVVVGLDVVIVDVARSIGWPGQDGWGPLGAYGPVVVELAVAFAFLGVLDDLGGVGESGGFRGHLKALAEGRITTGLVKLVGGPLFTLVILSGDMAQAGRLGHLRDAALICLAANLANLFDRAPGRVNKVGQIAFVVLALATRSTRLVPVAATMGGAAALLPGDLRESFMLGDAGSNVIGAVVGVGVVATTTETQRWILVAVLLGLNLTSEFVSFSRVIDAVPPLRRLDRLGSPHRPR